MGLRTNKTVLIRTETAVIKVTPQGNRTYVIDAPARYKITDRQGKPLTKRRPKA